MAVSRYLQMAYIQGRYTQCGWPVCCNRRILCVSHLVWTIVAMRAVGYGRQIQFTTSISTSISTPISTPIFHIHFHFHHLCRNRTTVRCRCRPLSGRLLVYFSVCRLYAPQLWPPLQRPTSLGTTSAWTLPDLFRWFWRFTWSQFAKVVFLLFKIGFGSLGESLKIHLRSNCRNCCIVRKSWRQTKGFTTLYCRYRYASYFTAFKEGVTQNQNTSHTAHALHTFRPLEIAN